MDEDTWMLALILSWPTCDNLQGGEDETVCADLKCWHACDVSQWHHLPLSGVKGVKLLEGTSVPSATGPERIR